MRLSVAARLRLEHEQVQLNDALGSQLLYFLALSRVDHSLKSIAHLDDWCFESGWVNIFLFFVPSLSGGIALEPRCALRNMALVF